MCPWSDFKEPHFPLSWQCFRALCCKGPPPARPEYDLVCIGLTGAGKTSLLSKLCSESPDNVVSTTGGYHAGSVSYAIRALPTPPLSSTCTSVLQPVCLCLDTVFQNRFEGGFHSIKLLHLLSLSLVTSVSLSKSHSGKINTN